MSAYELIKQYKKKYKMSVAWRLKKHAKIIDKHLNPNETIEYIMAGQLDNDHFNIFDTGILAITTERLIVGQKHLIVGYKFSSVTPDLYNDLQVESGIIWGTLCVDTIKEKIYVSNIDKKSLAEVETKISMFMQENKKKYKTRGDEDK